MPASLLRYKDMYYRKSLMNSWLILRRRVEELALRGGLDAMQQLPTDAYQLASAHHLGEPLAVYPARVIRSNLLYALIGVMLIGGMIFGGIHSRQWVVLIPILLLVLALCGLLESTRWLCSLQMVVCTEGLVRVWEGNADSIRWDEIRELWRDRRGGYTFSRTDGTRFIINHVFLNAEELSTTIEQEVTDRLLPLIISSFQRGDTVRFGKVRVSQRGMSTGGEILPWNEMGGLMDYGGIIAIKQKGRWRNWSYISIRETPNLCVLEALIEYMFEEQWGDQA
jgi:Family of unknown function (DUF6585)